MGMFKINLVILENNIFSILNKKIPFSMGDFHNMLEFGV